MQMMGVPRALQVAFLNSEGDLDPQTFQRLMVMFDAQHASPVPQGVPKGVLEGLPTVTWANEL